MSFKASKKRERKIVATVRGKPLIPSAAAEEWHSKQVKDLITEMSEDYSTEIKRMMRLEGTREYYAADAKLPISRIKAMFERMLNKWTKKFFSSANRIAAESAVQVDKHSFVSVGSSLKALGIKQPRDMRKTDHDQQMELYIQQNVALIKSVGTEFQDKIQKAVWNSLTSPEGSEQGAYGLSKYLYETTNTTKARADFIAMDQTKKLYSALNNDRMEQNGVTKFEWMHSSAGKTPRHTHLELDRQIFSTKGAPNELYYVDGTRVKLPKNDDGKPGHPINCRCRAVPVIDLSDD
jgi:uncharacterized protein with gpF-like domain